MTKHKSLIKLLTTTSIIALVTIPNIYAANVTQITGNTNLSTGTGLNPNGVFTTGNALQYDKLGPWTVTADIPAIIIDAIDLNGATAAQVGNFSVVHNTSIGNINNSGGGAILKILFGTGGDDNLTLNGTDYSGLLSIDLQSAGNQITITKDITFTPIFIDHLGGNAKLNVNGNITATDNALAFDILSIGGGKTPIFNITNDNQIQQVLFGDAASSLTIINTVPPAALTLQNNILPNANSANTINLTNPGLGGANFTIGNSANKFKEINVTVQDIGGIRNSLYVNKLQIYGPGTLKITSKTTEGIDVINIGDATKAATAHIAPTANTTLQVVNFLNDNSELVLENEQDFDLTLTLTTNIVPKGNNTNTISIINNGGDELIIDNGGGKIGTATQKFAELTVSGSEVISILPDVFATLIRVGEADEIGTDVNFSEVTATNLSFQGSDQTLTILDTAIIDDINLGEDPNNTLVLTDEARLLSDKVNGKGKISCVKESTIAGILNIGQLEVGAGDVTIITPGPHTINKIDSTGRNSLVLPDNFKLVGNIDNSLGGGGELGLTFLGNATITGTIGATNAIGDIKIGTGKVVFQGDCNADELIVNKGTFVPPANITLDELILINGATLALTQNTNLTSTGGLSADASTIALGQYTLTTTDNDIVLTNNSSLQVATSANGANMGGLILNGGSLDSTGTVTIGVNSPSPQNVIGKEYTVVTKNGGATINTKSSDITVKSNNARLNWDITTDANGNFILKAKDNSPAVVKPVVPAVAALVNVGYKNNNLGLANAILAGLSEDALDELGSVGEEERTQMLAELLSTASGVEQFDHIDNTWTSTIYSIMQGLSTDIIDNRLAKTQVSCGGIASGDNDISIGYGAWVSPLYSHGAQKQSTKTSGYNLNAGGLGVGFDTLIDEATVLGAAFTFIDSKVKYKGIRRGSKVDVDSYIISLYGMQNFQDNLFMQGTLSGSYHKFDSKRRRGANAIGFSLAKASYKAMGYSGELLGGYNTNIENALLTPLAGLRYSRFIEKAYTEHGSKFANLRVARNTSERIELVAGLRYSMAIAEQDISYMPEAHAFINHNLHNKKQRSRVRMIGATADLPTQIVAPVKTLYNVGTGMTIRKDAMELGLTYDAYFAKKYVGHQGTLKLKVDF